MRIQQKRQNSAEKWVLCGDYSFYGSSAYYRHRSFIASIKYFRLLVNLVLILHGNTSKDTFGSYIKGDKRLNKELRNYF